MLGESWKVTMATVYINHVRVKENMIYSSNHAHELCNAVIHMNHPLEIDVGGGVSPLTSPDSTQNT